MDGLLKRAMKVLKGRKDKVDDRLKEILDSNTTPDRQHRVQPVPESNQDTKRGK